MTLMEQCQIWNENDEYQAIIDAIEALPDAKRTPELDSELARAYNNLADVDDAPLFKKAISLLKPHEDYFKGDHYWNFRIAYAYYYLDQEGPALHYFKQALDARPGDEDTEQFIDDCRRRLSLPRFEKNFRQRTVDAWNAFVHGEGELRRLMDQKDQAAIAGELIAKCTKLLSPAFADVSFELGYNGKKYELILTPEGNRAKLFQLVYFQRHAPAALSSNWNILVGRQPSHGFDLRSFGLEVSANQVQAWVEKAGDDRPVVSLELYCEKLLPLLREDDGKVWWLLSTLTDQVLGEIPAMALIDSFDVLGGPKDAPGIPLSELPHALEDLGLSLKLDPEQYLENAYTAYRMEPDRDPDADWRMDVFAGATRCPALVNAYLNGESGMMDDFHRDGAVPGFLCYPLDCFADESDRSKLILDFRDALEAAVAETAGADAATFLGGASGHFCGYLDFIAWDLPAVLDAAAAFFKDSPLEWASFHTFRRDVGTIRLLDRGAIGGDSAEDQDGEDLTDQPESDGEGAAGSFVGFVLLSDAQWEKQKLIDDLKADWGIEAVEDDEGGELHDDMLVFSIGDIMAAVSMTPSPVPDGEAEQNAANNYMWPGAVDAAKAHKAQIMVAILGKDAGLIERGRLFVQVMSCCSKQAAATGLYTSGTVFQPRFYQGFAEMMKQDELPIFNWIWFGLYRTENGVCGYTYGMPVFGKDEMEVLDAGDSPEQVRDFLASLVSYVLEYDVVLQDGETIGFSANDKHTITRSEGVSLPGMTLKISYNAAD
ncbi:DUF4261 domain-containing protein [Anaerotruncus colihominis]|nr:DUF4261 domain-containing protein [Anaerotruncus colihominis]